jgi:drug/metabolite transporter (DMT)-like permease
MTPRTATLIGLTAILMWSLLAVMTVATGTIPAFQLAAMTFAIGALVGSLTWIGRGEAVRALRQPVAAWAVGVGGLFGYHALYFLALRFAPPAEAGLLNYLWPLLIVLFSSFLPAAVCWKYRQRHPRPGARPDRGVRRGLRVGDLFGALAKAQERAD